MKIDSFETVTLRESGMRCTTEYEIVRKGDAAEVSEYSIRYDGSVDRRVLEARAECPLGDALMILNDCKIGLWDGFHGKHPKHVKDGIMFSLNATVNGDRKIRAEGSENFPKHFRELRDGLHAILSQK